MGAIARLFRFLGYCRDYQRLARDARSRVALLALAAARCRSFATGDVYGRLMRKCFPVLRVRVCTLDNAVLFIDPVDKSQITIFDEIALERAYDLNLVPFAPTRIVDCGGHVGMFTAIAGAKFRGVPITTFEPIASNVALIERVRIANSLKANIVQAAVSTRSGTSTFHVRNSCGGSLSAEGEPSRDAVTVEILNFVNWLQQARPKRLLLKLDIEGEEERLVPALLPALPIDCSIFFETHRGDEGWAIVACALRGVGFDVRCTRERDRFRDGFAVRVSASSFAAGES